MLLTIEDGSTVKFNIVLKKTDKYATPLYARREGRRLWLSFGFNNALKDELKASLSGMKWYGYETPPVKAWACDYNEHNIFRLLFLAKQNPYAKYDQAAKDLTQVSFKYPLKDHQKEGVLSAIKTRRAIWAYEMGLGKSLMALEVIEHLRPNNAIWVAPRSALLSVILEYKKWGCTVPVRFMTYDGAKKYVEEYRSGDPAPDLIVGDESQKLKTPTAQRTQAFAHITRNMRLEHGHNCCILLMSGTPAPRTPVDWYSQCEIVEPGFLREGDQHRFKERLSLTQVKENTVTGGVYPETITWFDDSSKCKHCGQVQDTIEHDETNIERHQFEPSVNEVELLYKRMGGLVLVKTKKDCTDLPDKIYQRIYCKPTYKTLESMKLISLNSPSAIMALTRMRELSDGFQYIEEAAGTKPCEACNAKGSSIQPVYIGPDKTHEFLSSIEPDAVLPEDPFDFIIDPSKHPSLFELREDVCAVCNGSKEVTNYLRTDKQFTTAKDKALTDLLEEHDEVGRLVIYAGFTASVLKICELVRNNKWDFIKLDGTGWYSTLAGNPEALITAFQDKANGRRIAFIGNQGAASSGLTLTASPSIVYYSNTFNAEDRMQSEDRIHRLGMDVNRGARIIDLIHLPTDEYVLENLQKKRDLQNMSLGQLTEAMKAERAEYDYD